MSKIKRYRTKFTQFNELGELFCYKCSLYKDILEFDTSIQDSNVFYRLSKDRRCKKCKSNQYNKRKLASRGKRDLDRLLLERWHGLKDRSIKKGFQVDFNWEYLKELWVEQKGICNISGVPMTYIMNSGRVPTNVSVDKIESDIGYTKANIQLVCMAVNQMKSDLDMGTLIKFCKNIIQHQCL